MKNLAIHQSVTHDQRTSAFLVAQRMFDHQLSMLHDIEVIEGMASTLCLQLGYILNKGTNDGSNIVSIMSVLSLVYQCSDKTREKSFNQIGSELVDVICKSFWNARHIKTFEQLSNHIANILKLLSRLRSASILMASQKDILTLIQHILMIKTNNKSAKVEAVATLKNMSFYAEEYRSSMFQHPSLMDSLIRMCMDDGDEIGKEHSSAVIRNLAMAPDTKKNMAEHQSLMDTLVYLTDDHNIKAKRNAISTIGSLAIEEENSVLFVTHGEGIIVKIMTTLVERDEDCVIRRRAARILRSFGQRDAIKVLGDYQGIIDTLCRVAIEDSNTDTQVEAIEALSCYISNINEMTLSNDKVIDSMIKIAKTTPSPTCMEILVRSLNTISMFDSQRKSLIDHEHLLNALSMLSSDPKATAACQECGMCALYNLSCEVENREKMVCKSVLYSLTLTVANDFANQEAQKYAVMTLVNLAELEQNRKCMSIENNLLKGLLQYVIDTEDSMLKDRVKKTLMELIPLI